MTSPAEHVTSSPLLFRKTARDTSPSPPKHLSPEAKRWWRKVLIGWDGLEDHNYMQLQIACEKWDEKEAARLALERIGSLTYLDRYDCPRPRPEVAIMRDAAKGFLYAVREMGIDGAGTPEAVRPPSLPANRRGR